MVSGIQNIPRKLLKTVCNQHSCLPLIRAVPHVFLPDPGCLPRVNYLTSSPKLKWLLSWSTLAFRLLTSTKSSTASHDSLPTSHHGSRTGRLRVPPSAPSTPQRLFHLPGVLSLWSLYSWLPLIIQVLVQIHVLRRAFPGHPSYYPTILHIPTLLSSWYLLVSDHTLIYFPVYCLSHSLDCKLQKARPLSLLFSTTFQYLAQWPA